MNLFSSSLTLENGLILLKPPTIEDFEDLCEAFDPELWKNMSPKVRNKEDLRVSLVNALARIGAVKEGTLRDYIQENGIFYDVLYYSILQHEWPGVKESVFLNGKV